MTSFGTGHALVPRPRDDGAVEGGTGPLKGEVDSCFSQSRGSTQPLPTGSKTGVPASVAAPTVKGKDAILSADSARPSPTGLRSTGFVIDLPLPPSVNTMVRKLGNTSPGVRRWRMQADAYLYEQMRWLKSRAIKGPFLIDITWTKAELGKSDIDNRIKPLLDYLQSRELIENDKLCREMRVGFGMVNFGCRVEVLPRRT